MIRMMWHRRPALLISAGSTSRAFAAQSTKRRTGRTEIEQPRKNMKMKRLVTAAGVAGVLCMAASNVWAQGSPGGAGGTGGGGAGSAGGQPSIGGGGTAVGA